MPSEYALENNLIKKLQNLGYQYVPELSSSNALLENLKEKLEQLNSTYFSDREWKQILNYLNSGEIFDRALKIRDRFALHRDNDTQVHIIFFNSKDYLKNSFQLAHQIEQKGPRYLNRYDVTLLINGIPLVQIELKKPGVEMKEAFNQIIRYKKHTFSGTLFDFVELFIISNGVNTKYFASNKTLKFYNTFYWTTEDNKKISNLMDFADVFLNPKFLAEYIYKFIVLAKGRRQLFALRPYQYYASRRILERVKTSNDFGYIWHTTGSGKTLTAFKTAQLLQEVPEVKKVLFVVDRRDLDIQTTDEFNKFSPGSVDATTHTGKLVEQLADSNKKLIVTTLQKLNKALKNSNYTRRFVNLQNQKVVIIFDECHRSQFGATHAAIRRFFKRAQLFGFTGTPIFAQNAIDNKTTAQLFGKCLHKYIITNAIDDGNVLGFAVEYIGKYRKADKNTIYDKSIEVSTELDKQAVKRAILSWERIEKIVDYVIADIPKKLKIPKDAYGNIQWDKAQFNALFATSSVELLRRYYSVFKTKKPEGLKIAAVFSFDANEEDRPDGSLEEDPPQFISKDSLSKSNREFLDEIIADYNKEFGTNFSTSNFEEYYRNVQRKIKEREIHLTLVVNMLLTGFDSKYLNTLYVDKNLRYHGLIQAFSRTNRLAGLNKPHGNIVSFRNIKFFVDQALALYGDENAKEIVIGHNYEQKLNSFLQKLEELELLLGGDLTEQAVSELHGKQKVQFVKIFRELLRIFSSLETFINFKWEDLKINKDTFDRLTSAYKDLYEEVKNTEGLNQETGVESSSLQQLSFDLELLNYDIVDYDYIIELLKQSQELLQSGNKKAFMKQRQLLAKKLRSSEEWGTRTDIFLGFLTELANTKGTVQDIETFLNEYKNKKKQEELKELSEALKIPTPRLEALLQQYVLTGRLPSKYDLFTGLEHSILSDYFWSDSSQIKSLQDLFNKQYKMLVTSIKELANKYNW